MDGYVLVSSSTGHFKADAPLVVGISNISNRDIRVLLLLTEYSVDCYQYHLTSHFLDRPSFNIDREALKKEFLASRITKIIIHVFGASLDFPSPSPHQVKITYLFQ